MPWTNQVVTKVTGENFEINPAGAFFYEPTKGNGNLVASIAAVAGTDAYGNDYLAGFATYAANGTFAAMDSASSSYGPTADAGSTPAIGSALGSNQLILAAGTAGGAESTAVYVEPGEVYLLNAYMLLDDITSAPITHSTGGALFVENGALKYIGSSGTVTTLASA